MIISIGYLLPLRPRSVEQNGEDKMLDWERKVATARGKAYRKKFLQNLACWALGFWFGGSYMSAYHLGILMDPQIKRKLTVLLWSSVFVTVMLPLWTAWRKHPLTPPPPGSLWDGTTIGPPEEDLD